MTAAYPLTWPDHIERSRAREAGRFQTTLSKALSNVEDSLRRFAADSCKAQDRGLDCGEGEMSRPVSVTKLAGLDGSGESRHRGILRGGKSR